MNHFDSDPKVVQRVDEQAERQRQSKLQGEPTLARQLARVGVLGWLVVTPTLLGVLLGRWLDHRLGTGIFWTAPLLVLGLVIGCWSAWKWMHQS